MTNKGFVEGLRRVAEWYEEHPDFPLPYAYDGDRGIFSRAVHSKDKVIEAKKVFGKGAVVEADGHYFNVFKSFGGMQLNVWATRSNVCTKKVVGTKKVWKREATHWAEKEVEEEIVEWDCPDELQIKEEKKEKKDV